jgi:hypothetical protein
MHQQNLLVLKELAGNDPVRLFPLQELLEPHVPAITILWWLLWCATALYLLWIVYRAHRSRRD